MAGLWPASTCVYQRSACVSGFAFRLSIDLRSLKHNDGRAKFAWHVTLL